MEVGLDELIEARKDVLTFYSPYSFIREIREIQLPDQFDFFVKEKIEKFGTTDSSWCFALIVDGLNFIFLYEQLEWDSQYFQRRCYKLFTVLYAQQNASALIKAIHSFKEKLQEATNFYCYADIPSEDIFLIQCLTAAGVRLVETRLHYFRKKLGDFEGERYPVRKATQADIPALSKVAANSRNVFDRLHADFNFSEQEADAYLATYAEAAVNGFCDTVFVPDDDKQPTSSFLAFNLIENSYSERYLSWIRVSLASVGLENKGWLFKLLSEVLQYGKTNQVSWIEYPTQSSNLAAIRTCEKLGFGLGATTHILAFN